jgi:hypothetical protein
MNASHTPSLLDLSLIEQSTRNEAALAAIRTRAADIGELQRLVETLAARGSRVRPSVTTHPLGAQAECRLHLWLSCTLQELGGALEWLTATGITVTRIAERDTGRMRTYQLALRGQVILLNATLHDVVPASRFERGAQPAAA